MQNITLTMCLICFSRN